MPISFSCRYEAALRAWGRAIAAAHVFVGSYNTASPRAFQQPLQLNSGSLQNANKAAIGYHFSRQLSTIVRF
jgi:hypothetical protein